MKLELIEDKTRLAEYLIRHVHLNYYHLGDLDDFYWPNTIWYCAVKDGKIRAVSLRYQNFDGPIILGILNENEQEMRWLLKKIKSLLPDQIYAHLSPGLVDVFESDFRLEDHGPHFKMVLRNNHDLHQMDTSLVRHVRATQTDEVLALFERSYPGNWFNPAMLGTGMYFGWWDPEGVLRSISGVHVYAPEYGVAAIGNVTTDPEFRGRGLSTLVSGKLCQALIEAGTSTIGLNVKQDNPAAIRSYHKLGFEVVGEYSEMMMSSQ